MISNGGTYHHYFSKRKTTHTIASSLAYTKIKNTNTDKTVNPKWITDSLAAGKLLDYKDYLLFNNLTSSQTKLPFSKIEKNKSIEEKVFSKQHENETYESLIKDNINNDNTDKNQISNVDRPSSPDLFMDTSESERRSDQQSGMPLVNVETIEKFRNQETSPIYRSSNVSNTSNPNFLADFYSNSRLHHISTAGAMFKQYVKDLQNQEDHFTGRIYLQKWNEQHIQSQNRDYSVPFNTKIIMHIDMDCFFVSVGLKNHPELKTFPVAVTHAKNLSPSNLNEDKEIKAKNDLNSVLIFDNESKYSASIGMNEKYSMAEIASCSYEARQKGVKNGMLLGAALKICPELKTISYDFDGYKAVSKDLYDIVARFVRIVLKM